jgi:glutamyl/glutaminyl-tRNA synthetase
MTKTNPVRSRLAPTPSGLLHPGNGVSFLITWALIRAQGGTLLLRIDDLDKERCRKAYLEDIFRTIDWLGIDYDEGPSSVTDFQKHWSQHRRMDLYHAALSRLRQQGQLFACDCSRRKIRAASPDGSYPNSCQARKLTFNRTQVAWRLHLQQLDVQWKSWPDGWQSCPAEIGQEAFVVRQKNGRPAYQLASLIDDTHFGINWIVRGMDLLPSTIRQLLLAHLLQQSSFLAATFHHHSLVLGSTGEKLSKSKGAGSLQAWREAGNTAISLYQQAANLLSLQPPYPTTANDLQMAVAAQHFSADPSSEFV